MVLKPLKLWKKSLLITAEVLMVVVVLCLIGGGILAWRLNQGPVEIGFARKFIESELSNADQNIRLDVRGVFLEWSGIDQRPQIRLENIRLLNTQTGRSALGLESVSVTLSRTGLFVGSLSPRTIIINKPLLTVLRDRDGSFRLAMEQKEDISPVEKKDVDLARSSDILFGILDVLAGSPDDIPASWPIRSLRLVMMNEASMMVEDHVLGQSWLVPRVNLMFRRGQDELMSTAELWLDDSSRKIPNLKADVAYNAETKNIIADVAVDDLNTSFLASRFPDYSWLEGQDITLGGQAQARLESGLALSDISAKLESRSGQVVIPDLYDKPVAFKRLFLNLSYNGKDEKLLVRESDITLADDFSLTLSGMVQQRSGRRLNIPVSIGIKSLSQVHMKDFWPNRLDEEGAKDWALNRLGDGRIYDSQLDMVLDASINPVVFGPFQPGESPFSDEDQESGAVDQHGDGWDVTLSDLKAVFNIDGMTVDYNAPMLPLKKAAGKGVFDYRTDRLVIDVDSGFLGDLAVQSGKVVIDTVTGSEIGHAKIDAHLKGPLKSAFEYISKDPISVNLPTDIKKIEGSTDLKIKVSFPTLADLPEEDVIVSVEGKASDIFIPKIVSGLDVSGGPVDIRVKDNRVDVSGTGRLSGRDTKFTMAQYFSAKGNPFFMQAKASLMIDQGLRDHFNIDLSDWMEGAVPGDVVYTEFGDGKTEVDVKVDATPANLMVKPMNYTKPPGMVASASAKAFLKNGDIQKVTNLVVETPDGRVEDAVLEFSGSGKDVVLKKGSLPKARLKESDVAITFDINDKNIINMAVQGSFLDATPFLENDNKTGDYEGPGLSASVNVARMRTAEARLIENAKAYVSMDTMGDLNQLDLDAKAGRGKIVFRYRPDFNRNIMTLRIESDDAGAALRAFDVYENAVGGKLAVHGESTPGGNKRIVSGKADITDFKVVKAPALARLVNAISLTGVLELLGSDGIYFTRLETKFNWEKLRGGNLIKVSDGRTSGSSMGLTFEGSVDQSQKMMNITGTIVPVSLVNDILGNIPILGTILSGGSDGGVFAATYSVRGDVKNPTITVNPLAVLTPGFLRRIFFE